MREIKSEDQSVVLRRRLFRRDEDGANGASDRNRTCNPLITNQLRYRCATLARPNAQLLYDNPHRLESIACYCTPVRSKGGMKLSSAAPPSCQK